MSVDARVNLAYAIVTTAPTTPTAGTSMVVSGFATLPAVPFNAIVHQAGATEAQIASGGEFVRVTANSSGTLTIVRASEGPNAARTIVNGDIVKAGITANTINTILAGGPFTGMTVTPTASTTNRAFDGAQTLHGTNPSQGGAYYGVNNFLISSDDADSGSDAGHAGVQVDWTFGGSSAKGNRIGMFAFLKQTAATGNTGGTGYYIGLQGLARSSSGDGGTNTGAGAKGSLFGANIMAQSQDATNMYSIVGCEFDIFATATSTQKYVTGVSAVSYHINAGATLDTAFLVYSGGSFSGFGPGSGFVNGLTFAELESNGLAPLRSTATAIGLNLTSLSSVAIANGIDFSKFTFSGNAILMGTGASQFTVGSTGRIGVGVAPDNGLTMKSAGAFTPQIVQWNDTNDANAPYVLFKKSRSGAQIQAADTMGSIVWQALDTGAVLRTGPQLVAVCSAVTGSSVTGYLQITDATLRSNSDIGHTSFRIPKIYATDGEFTNWPSIGGTSALSVAATFTGKRVTKRTGTTTSSATPTINTDNVDFYSLTAQAADITSMTTNLSGTPTEAQTLQIAITGTAARAITWGTSFESGAATLPTTTVTTNRLDVMFVWNTVSSKWRCMASG